MICRADIGYDLDIQENISISEIEGMYCDTVNIWLTGSGAGSKSDSCFRYILQYKNNRKYMEQTVSNATPNQAYIYGAIHAVKRIINPCEICVIVPVALGFETAFKGKGANSALINTLYDEIIKRKCTLTEVRFLNGAESIKSYIAEYSGDPKLTIEFRDKSERKEVFRNQYKEKIYMECLEKVCKVLTNENVDSRIIAKIMDLKP